MSQYIGLAALKEALGLKGSADDTVDDGVLSSTIVRASAVIDGYLDAVRTRYVGFSAGSNSRSSVGSNTRTYDGSGDDTLWIDDAMSVSSVSLYGTELVSTAYALWPYNESLKRAIILVQPYSSWQGLSPAAWPRGTANVTVVGYFGLNTVPDDVAQAALALSILYWRRYQDGDPAPGPTTAMGGQGQIENDPEAKGILEALYPRWGVPGVWGG